MAKDLETGPHQLTDWLGLPAVFQKVARMSTGFMDLDNILDGGYMPGGFYVMSGGTGGGKSTLARNGARRGALDGTRTLFLTLEESGIDTTRKLVAASAHVPVWRIEKRLLSVECISAIKGAKAALSDIPLFIRDNVCNFQTVIEVLRLHAVAGTKIAYIDQASWLNVPNFQSAYERAAHISRTLKQTAKDTGSVLDAIAELLPFETGGAQ
jgi:replicative DNA helicase